MIPNEVLDNMAAKHPMSKILSTMTMMGILPKPQEFQRIFLISNGHGDLAREWGARNMCFDPMNADTTPEAIRTNNVDAHNYDPSIFESLSPFMGDRSTYAPFMGKRIIIMIKQGAPEVPPPTFIKVSAEELSKERKPLSPAIVLPLAMAAAYAAYGHTMPEKSLQGLERLLATPQGVALATVLSLGAIKTFNRVMGPKAKGQYSPEDSRSNPDANDVFSRIEEMKQKPLNKTGMIKSALVKGLIFGMTAPSMVSGVLQKHRELSPYDEEGRIKGFIRRNPDFISAALIADAVLSHKEFPVSSGQAWKKVKEIANVAIPAAKRYATTFGKLASIAEETYGEDALLKTASAQDFLTQGLIWPLAMGPSNLPGRVIGGLFDQAVIEAGSKLLEKRQKNQLKVGQV
jgi:hypothetical protein